MRIVVELTPGSAPEPANPTGSATTSAAARASVTSAECRLIVGVSLGIALLRTRVAAARDQLPDSPEQTADAVRDDEHEQDQDDAVDDGGAARLLSLLDDPLRQVRAQVLPLCPERQEGDEDRPEDEPRQATEAPDDDADEEVDRERDGEGVRIDERAGDGEQPAGDARIRRADPEGERLVPREADTRGNSRGLAVAHGAERTPRPSTEDEPRDRECHERDRPGQVVHPVVRSQ